MIEHEGDLDLSHLTSPEGLELPEHVGGCLDLSGLTSAEVHDTQDCRHQAR